jgi:hypothetical protein
VYVYKLFFLFAYENKKEMVINEIKESKEIKERSTQPRALDLILSRFWSFFFS